MRQKLRNLARRYLVPPRPVILMYHRIAEPAIDPWDLSVPPDLFQDQLNSLARRRTPLSMDQLVEKLASGELPGDAVAITFDDGYTDNATVAKPLLEAAGIPATMFLSTKSLGTGEPFWWDELAHMILLYPGAVAFELTLGGKRIPVEFPGAGDGSAPPPQRSKGEAAANGREAIYLKVWSELQRVSLTERRQGIDSLRGYLGRPDIPAEDLPMSWAQAQNLPSDLICVGAHAQTHRPLTDLAPEDRRAEILGSLIDCQRQLGVAPTGFAYPHGDRDGDVIAAVREAGFTWACSTAGSTVSRSHYDLHDLPRIAVGAWSGPELLDRIRLAG